MLSSLAKKFSININIANIPQVAARKPCANKNLVFTKEKLKKRKVLGLAFALTLLGALD
jgi:hypothetical protein